MKRLHFFLLLLILTPGRSYSQTWEVGGFMGGSGYAGDLNPVKLHRATDLAFGGQIKRNFNPVWALKLNIMHGTVRANDAASDDPQNRQRNLSFFSPVTEFGLQLEFNFFKYVPSLSSKLYTPYLFTGVGQVTFNPKTKYDGNTYQLSLYGTEGQNVNDTYRKAAVSVPYGAGVKYNVAGKWSLIGEIGYRTAFTDYLDDVSGRYPDKSLLINATAVALSDRSGEQTGVYTGVYGTQRGDFRKRDTYMFMGISLTYTIIPNKCPVVD
ncbi:DUF6089 family protein [Hufsiella ginkgonis]|uniref:Outer membrane beta-barrel protein n=1 Tax=Hufsiella ginkgonis TaxID=2695274 RepID=A0A7K1Y4K5_9SPHI|nr:DUF6089 family protein [Hufsiella ginkgonis]MXV17787.1 outer membrane beta-barrel protein [Hufsiella ginkgonis]